MVRKISSMVAGVTLLLVGGLAFAADTAPSPFIGTWVLNVSKSKFEGAPAVKSYSITISDAGGGKLHNVAQWVEGSGAKGQSEYTASADGKPTPVTGYANADAVVVRSKDPRSTHMSMLKGGKEVEWGRYKVSADGKTMHGTEGGTDETGTKYKWTEFFEKQ